MKKPLWDDVWDVFPDIEESDGWGLYIPNMPLPEYIRLKAKKEARMMQDFRPGNQKTYNGVFRRVLIDVPTAKKNGAKYFWYKFIGDKRWKKLDP